MVESLGSGDVFPEDLIEARDAMRAEIDLGSEESELAGLEELAEEVVNDPVALRAYLDAKTRSIEKQPWL